MQDIAHCVVIFVAERLEPTKERAQGMCLDKGYDNNKVRATLREFGFTAHIRSHGKKARKIACEVGKCMRR